MSGRGQVSLLLAGLLTLGGLGCKSTSSDAGLSSVPCPAGCPSGQVCFNSACVADCVLAGGSLCGALCVDLLGDDLNCGGCGNACSGNQVCSDGGCSILCPATLTACIGASGASYCTNLLGDSTNCGACASACASDQICLDGGCQSAAILCPAPQTLCALNGGGSACRDLQSDPRSCGTCVTACDAWEACDGGHCVGPSSCPAGLALCPTSTGSTTCADLQTDIDNCGRCGDSCGMLAACTSGGCSCHAGFTACPVGSNSECSDLSTDVHNCGGCGQSCVACEQCFLSSCAATAFLTASTPVPFGGGDAGLYPNGVTIGDFNGDGNNDLAVVGGNGGVMAAWLIEPPSPGSSLLEIRFGDGHGGFPSATTYAPADMVIYGVASGDVNGDGVSDIVLSVIGSGSLVGSGFIVLESLSDGGLAVLGPYASGANASGTLGFAVADFNSDGLSDVAIGNPDSGVDLFYSTGDGGFLKIAGQFLAIDAYAPVLAAGDLDGDGRADLVVSTSNGAFVQLQTADGGLGPIGPEALSGGDYPLPVILGRTLALVRSNGAVSAYSLDGNGVLDLVATYSIPNLPYSYGVFAARGADLNSDGIPDLLVTDQQLHVWLSQGGDSGFGEPVVTIVGVPNSFGLGIAVGDLNGDGRPDVAVAGGVNGFDSETAILLNGCSPSP